MLHSEFDVIPFLADVSLRAQHGPLARGAVCDLLTVAGDNVAPHFMHQVTNEAESDLIVAINSRRLNARNCLIGSLREAKSSSLGIEHRMSQLNQYFLAHVTLEEACPNLSLFLRCWQPNLGEMRRTQARIATLGETFSACRFIYV